MTWKMNHQQLFPPPNRHCTRGICICCYISTLTWVSLSFPSHRCTNTHTIHAACIYTHTSSPTRTPLLPPTHTRTDNIYQNVKQDRLFLERPSPYAPKNSRCVSSSPRWEYSELQNKWKDVYPSPE